MKSLLVIIAGLYTTWYFTDIESESAFYNGFMPFVFFLFLVAFVLWLVIKGGMGGRTDSGGDGGFFDSDGGDGGGGGD